MSSGPSLIRSAGFSLSSGWGVQGLSWCGASPSWQLLGTDTETGLMAILGLLSLSICHTWDRES